MGDRIFNMEKGSQYIEHLESQTININIDKVENMNVGDVSSGHEQDETDNTDEEIVTALTPIFFGIREEAAQFLKMIKGMKSTAITSLVTRLVREKKISERSCKRDLWTILHNNGLYEPGEKNWDAQV